MTDARAAERFLAGLRARGWRVAVAESLTGGLVTSALVEVPGASVSLVGSVTAYETSLKHDVLGVDARLLAEHGPVHPDVAAQMAAGVRRVLAVDGREPEVGLATTGIAGPQSPDGQPVGTVHIAVAAPSGPLAESHVFSGTRAEIRAQAVAAVLRLALDVL
ncbi:MULTISPECIES: CinA family protein [unclassified Microbacterium]|uniref:CinA family protein n=1 Tax=unclassified Microbacterium TaxID=2609290 RepID=UPI00097F37A7|nr:CinA family protein [Microbacterium sp. JB110]RCS59100.1 CinA family protein [Microbacterium sp. JB110]SJM68781.1 C-terminal domain of CinA type S [Frigoribacterium sp. JB110]